MSVTQGATNDRRGARVSGISIGKDEDPDRRRKRQGAMGRGLSDRCKRKDEKLKRRVSDRSKGKTRKEGRQKSVR